jgi:hypothetical protein
MTLAQRYAELTQSLTIGTTTFPPAISEPLTVEKLQQYARQLTNSKFPAVRERGFEMNRNIFTAGNDLNGSIYRQVSRF